MEQWLRLLDFPGYSVSNMGRVRNDRTSSILALGHSKSNHPFVKMWRHERQVTRGVALLVAQAFVPLPAHRYNTPTPIHLDGDATNCQADNLTWRPRWFANKHARQFTMNLENPNRVRNIDTGVEYDSVWSIVFEQGVLFNDVVKSIINKTYVYPLFQRFEWVDPD